MNAEVKDYSKVRAVIPVAGMGTRLRPITHTMPKALIPVAGKPMLAHILDEIAAVGIEKVTIILGYLGEQIQEFVETHYNFKVDYCQQETCLGLGHAIYLAKKSVDPDEDILILLGDTLFDADLPGILASEESVICVKEVADPQRFGVVLSKGTQIIDLVEKPDQPISNLAIVGIYYIRATRALFDALSLIIREDKRTKGEYQLTDALKMILQQGIPMSYNIISGWYDCGKPETLLQTNSQLLQKCDRNTRYEHREDGVILIHPVALGLDVQLSQAIIGPNVTIGDAVTVNQAILSECIINYNANVENTVLTHSIIGENASVCGASTSMNVGDSAEIRFKHDNNGGKS